MTPSTRDRISVDLRGLKGVLVDRAQVLGVSPSGLVRAVIAEALGQAEAVNLDRVLPHQLRGNGERVRLCLRMSRDHARATVEAARHSGLSVGDYIAGLVADVPVLTAGSSRADHIGALMASSAELSTLSRNIHRLTVLLRQANVEPSRAYREMLDRLAGDVRGHLELAARVLADLRPRSGGAQVGSRAVR